MTLNKINPTYRNLNSTNQSLGVPVKIADINPIIDEINSQDTRITALEDAPAGGSRVIASLENVNLKDVAANVLTWASGKSAANTAPSSVVVTMAANDTYVDDTTVIGLTLGAQDIGVTISFDSFVSQVNINNNVIAHFNGIILNSGNWALPVTQGTLNDFRVNIYILGDTI